MRHTQEPALHADLNFWIHKRTRSVEILQNRPLYLVPDMDPPASVSYGDFSRLSWEAFSTHGLQYLRDLCSHYWDECFYGLNPDVAGQSSHREEVARLRRKHKQLFFATYPGMGKMLLDPLQDQEDQVWLPLDTTQEEFNRAIEELLE